MDRIVLCLKEEVCMLGVLLELAFLLETQVATLSRIAF